MPSLGDKCMRNPGPALTSITTPLFSLRGTVISFEIISMPQISKLISRAIRSARKILKEWTSSVTSFAVPPELKFAVPFKYKI